MTARPASPWLETWPRRLVISFSGGETSAFMTWWLLHNARHTLDDVVVIFANTGQEREETLAFVKRCDDHFGFDTIWVEAAVHHRQRKSSTATTVDHRTASRDGQPFEEVVKKYGIPNAKFPHCTRELKTRPIEAYIRSIGWQPGTYVTAIGIRADEMDRRSAHAKKHGLIYPLISMRPTAKPEINSWWARQPFRLELKSYQGNCAWCWKKTLRKHLTLIDETPEIYDFPERMERQYGHVGPEFAKTFAPGYRRTFFRGNMSTDDLRHRFATLDSSFEPADDEAQRFGSELDLAGGCGESCEIYSDLDDVA